MELKYIKELIQVFEKSTLNKMVIREKHGVEITLEKGLGSEVRDGREIAIRREIPIHHDVIGHMPEVLKSEVSSSDETIDLKNSFKSPMVGTFYRAGSPTDKPFVEENDTVDEGQVLCIVEAMKVMNEIKSPKRGRIRKMLVSNGQPVEYGQPLFIIE